MSILILAEQLKGEVSEITYEMLGLARKLAGDRLLEDLRGAPGEVEPALDAITETMARHAWAAIEAGADGLFFATQTAAPDVVTRDECVRFELPRMRRVLEVVAGREHPRGADFVIVYAAEVESGTTTAGDDADAVEWFDRTNLPPLAFKATQKILNI